MSEVDRIDRLYLRLLGARESLCLAQMDAPEGGRYEIQDALDCIDRAGTEFCPQQWSKFNRLV